MSTTDPDFGPDADPGVEGIQQLPPAPDPFQIPTLGDTPGTRRFEQKAKAKAQLSTAQLFRESVAPVASNVIRFIADEGIAGFLLNFREEGTSYDKAEASLKLPPSFNLAQAQSALAEDTLEGHMRAVQRIVDDNARGARLAQQPAGSQLGIMAASFLDADLPLVFFTAGAAGAPKLTLNALRLSKRIGLAPRAATRLSGASVGALAGFEAGAIIGIADQRSRGGAQWTDLAAILLTSTAMGTVLGGTFNLNRHLNQKLAEGEFFARMAKEDVTVTQGIDLEAMLRSADGKDAPTVIGGEQPQSLGAAATGTGGRPKRVLEDPAGPIPEPEADWINYTDKWRHDGNFLDSKSANDATWWAAVATSRLGGFSTHNFHDLYKSNSSMANWIAGTIFESPSGLARGRATASVLMEMYHGRIQNHIAGTIDPLMNKWARETDNTWYNSGHYISNAGKRAWSRELMLEMSDRAVGRKSIRNLAIREAADLYDRAGFEAWQIGRGGKGQRALDGFEENTGVKPRSGYNPYKWDGYAINKLMRDGVTIKEITTALAEGYRRAGMDTAKDAEAVAKAVVQRARRGDFGFDSSVGSMLSGDGRQFLMDHLAASGMSKIEIDNLMSRLLGEAEEAGKESFAKRRNELDLSVQIKNKAGHDLQLVDLLDQNMHRTWQRYARQMSGAAALARQGITNRSNRKVVISALRAETRALGENVPDTDLMNAMFSHFDAGPVWGFSGGVVNKGIGRVAATAKRLANISLLEQLGLTQLGELGAVIAQQGVAVYYRRGIQPWFNAELRAADGLLLDDMAYFGGQPGLDHRFYAEWQDLDDVGIAASRTLTERIQQTVSDVTSNAAFFQNYLNLFNLVRTYQQKVAMKGMADKVFRELRDNGGSSGPFLQRATRDLGLDQEILEQLEALMTDPTKMEWDASGKFVARLHFDNWDPDLVDTFGAALFRNKNQVVQKSMAGEQDAWMHSGWGSIMTHLVTFPMAAFQKQFIRQASHMDLASFNALSMGMMTALIAVNIKDAINGRDDDAAGRVTRAFNYNNMSSWASMIWDPAMTVLGQNDLRFSNFGPYDSIVPPTINQLDHMRRAPGAIINAIAGDFNYYDRQALKALPFATTYGIARMFKKAEAEDPRKVFDRPSIHSLSDILANPGVAAAIRAGDE